MDQKQFPREYRPNGNAFCSPYLASLVRLADEIDGHGRQEFLGDLRFKQNPNEIDLTEFMKHEAVRGLKISEERLTMLVHS